jgi:hypothetical protein
MFFEVAIVLAEARDRMPQSPLGGRQMDRMFLKHGAGQPHGNEESPAVAYEQGIGGSQGLLPPRES